MRANKVYEAIMNNIEHHEMNEHMYRRPYKDGSRGTTKVTKNKVIDLILEHLGLEVKQATLSPAKLVKMKKDSEEL